MCRAAGGDRFTVTAVSSAETVATVSANADGSKLTLTYAWDRWAPVAAALRQINSGGSG